MQGFRWKAREILGEIRRIRPCSQRTLWKHYIERSRARKTDRGTPGGGRSGRYRRGARRGILADASKTRQAQPVVMFGDYGGRLTDKAVLRLATRLTIRLAIVERLRDLYICGGGGGGLGAHARGPYISRQRGWGWVMSCM